MVRIVSFVGGIDLRRSAAGYGEVELPEIVARGGSLPRASEFQDAPQALVPASVRYDAFVSYSHAADGKLAPALQGALQGFAKPWYRRRALHLFRDKTSLAVTPHLWPSIERALGNSRYFLLLASPDAAQSAWVQQEVEWWLAHRSAQTILLVLTTRTLA